MGITHVLALSDGTTFDRPRRLQASLRKLCVLQRSLARKKRGGNNRRKAAYKLARLHEKIANQRHDWWHKTTRQMVDQYGVIVLEGLSPKFMLPKGHRSRAAHDVGLGIFRDLLAYKVVEAGARWSWSIPGTPARHVLAAGGSC